MAARPLSIFDSSSLKRQKLSEQIAQSIQQMIVSGTFRAGDRLPSERELAESFNVNRSTAREAIHLLRERGLVERKSGRGTHVTQITPETVGAAIELFFLSTSCTHRELSEVRSVLEPKIASLAAKNATPEAVAGLGELVSEMEQHWAARDFSSLASADAAFHLALAAATRNQLFVAIASGLSGVLKKFVALQYAAARGEEGFRTHRTIFEAVLARDAARAAEAMYQQLILAPSLDT